MDLRILSATLLVKGSTSIALNPKHIRSACQRVCQYSLLNFEPIHHVLKLIPELPGTKAVILSDLLTGISCSSDGICKETASCCHDGRLVNQFGSPGCYLHVPIHPGSHKYFQFAVNRHFYEFQVVPFGILINRLQGNRPDHQVCTYASSSVTQVYRQLPISIGISSCRKQFIQLYLHLGFLVHPTNSKVRANRGYSEHGGSRFCKITKIGCPRLFPAKPELVEFRECNDGNSFSFSIPFLQSPPAQMGSMRRIFISIASR